MLDDARTFLFVPGDRPERYAKAAQAGADIVIIDLEDAVLPDRKTFAREALGSYLENNRSVVVRINAPGTAWFADDIAQVNHWKPAGVVVPKVEGSDAFSGLTLPLLPLIETANGFANLSEICSAERVSRCLFGTIDFMQDLGIADDGPGLAFFRSQMVLMSRLAGIAPPVDGVTTNFTSPDATTIDTRRALEFGFSAKLCIHPRQVDWVHKAMCPSSGEIEQAQKIILASQSASHGAIVVDGKMVDRPVIERAMKTLRYVH